MALWGDKDDIFSAGTVSVKLAGINTYYQDGLLVEASPGTNQTDSDTTPPYSGQVVFQVIGSIGAGAGTSFGKGVGFAKTGDILKFGDIVGGTYYGNGIVVGIASTTLCYIGSTEGFSASVTDATLAGLDYTVNEQTTYTSQQGRWSQQNLSSEEEALAGFVGLAFSMSPTGVATDKFVLDGAYTEAFNVDGEPRVLVGDSISTSLSSGGYEGLGNDVSVIGASAEVAIQFGPLTQNAGVGVNTVAISTGGINVGDTFQGNNICTAVATIGLATVGFAATIGYGLTSGNIVSIGRTVSNVFTNDGTSVVSIAATETVRVTRGTGADKVYLAGVSTTGAGSATSTAYEVAHGGWVGVTSYFDQAGNLRVKSETLVAMSGIATGNNPVWGAKPSVS